MGNVALTLAELGRWAVAEELQEQVVRANAKIFGSDHLDTLTGVPQLGNTLSRQNVEAGRRARNAKSRQKDNDIR